MTFWYNIFWNKFALARMRRDYPIAFFLPGLIIGQVVGFYLSWCALCLMGVLFSIIYFNKNISTVFHIFILSFLCGCASFLMNNLAFDKVELSQESSYLVQVDQTPRYRKPGQIELSLKIFSRFVSSKNDNEAKELVYKGNTRILCKAVNLPWRNIRFVKKGSYIVIKGRFRELKKTWQINSYTNTLIRKGYRATCRIYYSTVAQNNHVKMDTKIRDEIEEIVHEVLGNNEVAGLLLSMAVGFRDVISNETEWSFKLTGLAHLLIVSGYQVTVIFYFVMNIFRLLLTSSYWICARVSVPMLCNIMALITATAYVLLCGIDGSSLRAILALIFIAISQIIERGGGMLNAIFVSFLVLSLIFPCAYLEPGVQLTYAALGGICVGLSLGKNDKRVLYAYIKINFLASLFTSLIVIAWFDHVSLVGFLLNPIFAPFVSVIGCKVGLSAIFVKYINLDPLGYLMQACAWMLACFRDLLLFLSEYSFIAIKCTGILKYTLMGVITIAIHKVLKERVQNYLLENNCYRIR